MSFSIKHDIQRICTEIGGEFPGWSFTSGEFKNKTLKHTDLIVHLFSDFSDVRCFVSPAAMVANKRTAKLAKKILGYELDYLSMILFQRQSEEYQGPNSVFAIWREKTKTVMGPHRKPIAWPSSWIDLNEAPAYLRKVLRDGIGYLNQYYDLSSEEDLLRHLPTSEKVWVRGGMEESAGVMQCLAHVVLGDFDFVERYRRDEFKTVVPKRIADLDKIIAALPELKKRYAETGEVI